jgi:DNA-binding SARP family transcriptional activator
MVLLAEAATALADDTMAAELHHRLLPFADRFVPVNAGAAAWGTVARPLALVAEQLGHTDEAIAHLVRAIEVCAHLGARPWLVQAQLDLADTLVRAGRTNDPRVATLFADASIAADRLELGRFAEQVDDLRRHVQARPPPTIVVSRRSRPSISVLGAFDVTSADGKVARWTSRKARELCKILVAHRGAPVHREVLMDLLWPGVDPALLGNRLSVALSTVRRALDPDRVYGTNDLITADHTTVRMRTDQVDIDVEQFLVLAREALAADHADRTSATELLAQALRAHRGPALPDEPYAEWAAPLQSEVSTAQLRIARALASRAVAAGDDLAALDALRRVVDTDPLDDESYRQLVDAILRIGASVRPA